jgi:hypothetical protein
MLSTTHPPWAFDLLPKSFQMARENWQAEREKSLGTQLRLVRMDCSDVLGTEVSMACENHARMVISILVFFHRPCARAI